MASNTTPKAHLEYDHLIQQGGRAIFKAVRESQGFDGQNGRPAYDPKDWDTELTDWQQEEYYEQAGQVMDMLEAYGVIRFTKDDKVRIR